MQRSAFGLAALLATLAVAACAQPVSSGLVLHARVGPTCPVERDPPDPRCADRPYVGALEVQDAQGHTAARVTTDANGTVVVALRPGNYTVVSPTSQQLPRCGPVQVTVEEAHYAPVVVDCDSGIR